MSSIEEKISRAQSAGTEELWKLIRESNPEILSNATLNRNFTEEMAVFVAKKNATPQETLGFLASDIRFKDSYKLKLALCRNPKSPPRVSLSLIKFLRIFDLSDITRSKHLPTVLRQKVELAILERIPTMPAGVKIALSKRANSKIILALMERGDKRVASECLNSGMLTEEHLYQVVNRERTSPFIISCIAEHPKWSLRYLIRYGLIRNFHTPMSFVTDFISGMKTKDLQELHNDPKLPDSTRPFIFRELKERGEPTELSEDRTYDLEGSEDGDLDDTWNEVQS
ncbi:MAG: hypothetical protein JSV21_01690 [Nitrospirota bacterium]|nr:MAG: hypothetical protein JSV21_01690 [Nitrospirota bacterium]